MMFTKEFTLDDKKIIFIGTTHGPEREKINYLQEQISSLKPDLILIEGGFENATFRNEEEAINNGWELGFVSFFAKANNISLNGNDPSNNEIINFVSSNYSEDLAFLYFILRNLSILLKQNSSQTSEEKIRVILNDFENDSGWKDYPFSWENFLSLFKDEFDETFNIDNEYMDYFNPTLDISQFNEISKKLSLFRDNFLKDKLIEYVKSYDKILIVKGQGHFKNYERLMGEILDDR